MECKRAEMVEAVDGLPDLAAPTRLVVRVREAVAPVAEVGRDHEDGARLRQVAREQAAVLALGRAAQRAHQYRHHREVVLAAPVFVNTPQQIEWRVNDVYVLQVRYG